MNRRVLLGMSGGIDSSVSAIMLLEKGYEVVGVTFRFTELGGDKTEKDAAELAQSLGIQHHVIDLREEFASSVVQYFKEEYISGRTPFPCAYCNPKMKFKHLVRLADNFGCWYIATGHYARMVNYKQKNFIAIGKDPEKDQSFFLWGLDKNIRNRLIFPLGDFYKNEIRDFAAKKGFVSLSRKKDSLGICFIEGNDYRKFLEKEGIFSEPGNFVDEKGNFLGRHQGITRYTIGQRRGLGIQLNFPVFVAEIRLDENEIVLAKYSELYKEKLFLRDVYVSDNEVVCGGCELIVKVRYRLQETPCELNILEGARAEVSLLKPEAMIAPGQTAVFYKNDRVVGGGFIESAI